MPTTFRATPTSFLACGVNTKKLPTHKKKQRDTSSTITVKCNSYHKSQTKKMNATVDRLVKPGANYAKHIAQLVAQLGAACAGPANKLLHIQNKHPMKGNQNKSGRNYTDSSKRALPLRHQTLVVHDFWTTTLGKR